LRYWRFCDIYGVICIGVSDLKKRSGHLNHTANSPFSLFPSASRFLSDDNSDVLEAGSTEREGVKVVLAMKRRADMEFEGYCVKCRERRTVKDGVLGETSKGQPLAKGTCPECGTTVTRFISAKDKEAAK
jgi:hypothetical protein